MISKWIIFTGNIILLLLVLTNCSLFEYHPYEVRIADEEKNLNRKAFEKIQVANTNDTVTFILIGDTQRFYDETVDFVNKANSIDADFVVLNGDISDFGLAKEYHWVHRILSKLNKPYIGVIGNHDLLGNGRAVFEEMYGPMNDSFLFNNIKFIFINTNSREYQFKGNTPDMNWLGRELDGTDFSQAVVIGHVPPFNQDFDSNLERPYAALLKNSGKVKLTLYAHQHGYSDEEYYGDGVRYVVVSSMKERLFVVINIWADGFSLKKIQY